MTANKDKALQDWAQGNPDKTDSFLFGFLGERGGACAIVPIPGQDILKRYLHGGAWKRYDFALQAMLPISDSTDDTNTGNMLLQRQWQDWIRMQEAAKNYPDFGPDCSDYRLELLADTPQLAMMHESGMAKYQFYARLIYFEREDT